MSKNKKHKFPLDKILGKLNHICDIADEMTTEVKSRKEPDLSELATELKNIRYLNEVWLGNVNRSMDELESAILIAMTGTEREVG